MLRRLLVGSALLLSANVVSAQSTKYYIQDGDSQRAFIVQGGSILSTYTLLGGLQYPLAFNTSTTFLSLYRNGSLAVERNLDGSLTGNTFSHAQNVDEALDGGTDGTNTYVARYGTGGIYKGDSQFGGLTQIYANGTDFAGVTFNSATGTVFATGYNGILYELSTSGSVISTSNYAVSGRSLAYESATNSLWTAGQGEIYNLGLNGNLIATVAVNGLDGNYFGGEMQATTTTPEPATLALFAPGLLAAFAVARRRRRSA